MANLEQTIKILFPDSDSEISKINQAIEHKEPSQIAEPLDLTAFSVNDIELPREAFKAIQEELDRKRRFEDSVIKLANQDTHINIFDGSPNSKTKADKIPRTRKTNLIRAIEAAVRTFDKKPSLDELWQYFENDRDETGFIEDFKDDCLTWRDTKGKLHDTQKTTIANHLAKIKS